MSEAANPSPPSAAVLPPDIPGQFRVLGLHWGLVVLGMVLLFGPTFNDLAHGVWTKDEQAHGPLILAVSAWLFWGKREALAAVVPRPAPVAGWILMVLGVLLYALGRSQEIVIFEAGSLIFLLAGVMLLMRGWQYIKTAWFALFFLVFMLPLPGFVLDALTVPLKHNVSIIAEALLYHLGYPISRQGVVLNVGQYQLLVADACSGLNSMFSLTALGALYLYMTDPGSNWHRAIIMALILPIAFIANIVRVMILVLVTYHFGDEAGQGFVHDAAGMVLFVIALIMLFTSDSVVGGIRKLLARRPMAAAT
ncbi:MAG: exosortase B [Aquabacterium sp.]